MMQTRCLRHSATRGMHTVCIDYFRGRFALLYWSSFRVCRALPVFRDEKLAHDHSAREFSGGVALG